MKTRMKWIPLFLVLILTLSGCDTDQVQQSSSAEEMEVDETISVSETEESSEDTTASVDAADMFTDRDYEVDYDESESAVITLEETTASCSSNAVEISGSTVTIVDEGTYILTGTLSDGMIIINADKSDKVQIVLNGVSIHSETSAAIYVLQADKVFITIASGTENTLSNGGTFEAIDENNIDAVIFSKDDLTLNGLGTLTIESPAGHGVVSKDDLVITSGTYSIISASHGLSGKDSVRIADGSIAITAGKDGIHSENSDDDEEGFVYILGGTFDISAEGDGISASAYLQIDGGEITILAGGGSENSTKDHSSYYGFYYYRGSWSGESDDDADDDSTSMKGIKANGSLMINGGNFAINAADDGIHSNASIAISGGTIEIATGDDGIHADADLTVSGGTIDITECYEGLESLDMLIEDGEITIVATDDGLNAAGGTDSSGSGGRDALYGSIFGTSSGGSIVITGGTLIMQASGDGIDSNGSFEMSGGYVFITGANSGDTSILDYTTDGFITGGTFLGTGYSMMPQNFDSSSTQGAILITGETQSEGAVITLSDADGNVILSFEAGSEFSCMMVSCEELTIGETFTLAIGDLASSITLDSAVYSSSSRGWSSYESDGGSDGPASGSGGGPSSKSDGAPDNDADNAPSDNSDSAPSNDSDDAPSNDPEDAPSTDSGNGPGSSKDSGKGSGGGSNSGPSSDSGSGSFDGATKS